MAAYRDKRRAQRPWVLDISYTDRRTGKRKRFFRNATLQTADGARSEERALLVVLAERGFIPEPKDVAVDDAKRDLSFKDALALYDETVKPALKPSTAIGYGKSLIAYIEPRFGKMKLSAIDRPMLIGFDRELERDGLSPATRNNLMIPLRTIVRNAIELGRFSGRIDFPPLNRVQSKVYEPPSPEQVAAIIRAAEPHVKVAIALAAYAGERAGEVIAQRWANVNLATKTIFVREAMTHGILVLPKSGHERSIPIAGPLLEILEDAYPKRTSEYVAPSRRGTPWTHGGLRHAFQRALDHAKVPRARIHDFRHFFITRCFAGGAGAPTVQKLAGHAHLSVTARYAHTTEALMREAVQVFDQVERVNGT